MLRTSSGQTMFRFLGKEEAKAYVNRIADVSVERECPESDCSATPQDEFDGCRGETRLEPHP